MAVKFERELRAKEAIKSIKLDNLSILMAPVTTSSALLLSNRLVISKFINSLEVMIDYCPWLACCFQIEEDGDHQEQGVYVVPRKPPNYDEDEPNDRRGYLLVEFETFTEEYSSVVSIQQYLPSKNHIKMERLDLALESLQDLPICALKLTQYSNNVTILGYRFNHVFYDQSSLVYFLIFLSHLYSTENHPTLSPPIFEPRSTLVNPQKVYFANQAEYDLSAPKGYQASEFENKFRPPYILKLRFNTPAIDRFKALSAIPISGNDIFHAILSAASLRFRFETCLKDDLPSHFIDTPSRVLFARNMRPILGRSISITGDYVRLEVLYPSPTPKSPHLQAEHMSSLEEIILFYAQQSRKHLNQTSFPYRDAPSMSLQEIYETECAWFLQYTERNPLAGNPFGAFMNDPFACVVTNWSSFPYESIQFTTLEDGVEINCSVQELLIEKSLVMMGCGCFCRIIFEMIEEKRSLIACVESIHERMISLIQEIVDESQLFTPI